MTQLDHPPRRGRRAPRGPRPCPDPIRVARAHPGGPRGRRSKGATGPAEIRRIWTIVSYQRDLGINLAGVEAILKLRDHMDERPPPARRAGRRAPRGRWKPHAPTTMPEPDPNRRAASRTLAEAARCASRASPAAASRIAGRSRACSGSASSRSACIGAPGPIWHLVRRGRLIRERLGPPARTRPTCPSPTNRPRIRPTRVLIRCLHDGPRSAPTNGSTTPRTSAAPSSGSGRRPTPR